MGALPTEYVTFQAIMIIGWILLLLLYAFELYIEYIYTKNYSGKLLVGKIPYFFHRMGLLISIFTLFSLFDFAGASGTIDISVIVLFQRFSVLICIIMGYLLCFYFVQVLYTSLTLNELPKIYKFYFIIPCGSFILGEFVCEIIFFASVRQRWLHGAAMLSICLLLSIMVYLLLVLPNRLLNELKGVPGLPTKVQDKNLKAKTKFRLLQIYCCSTGFLMMIVDFWQAIEDFIHAFDPPYNPKDDTLVYSFASFQETGAFTITIVWIVALLAFIYSRLPLYVCIDDRKGWEWVIPYFCPAWCPGIPDSIIPLFASGSGSVKTPTNTGKKTIAGRFRASMSMFRSIDDIEKSKTSTTRTPPKSRLHSPTTPSPRPLVTPSTPSPRTSSPLAPIKQAKPSTPRPISPPRVPSRAPSLPIRRSPSPTLPKLPKNELNNEPPVEPHVMHSKYRINSKRSRFFKCCEKHNKFECVVNKCCMNCPVFNRMSTVSTRPTFNPNKKIPLPPGREPTRGNTKTRDNSGIRTEEEKDDLMSMCSSASAYTRPRKPVSLLRPSKDALQMDTFHETGRYSLLVVMAEDELGLNIQ